MWVSNSVSAVFLPFRCFATRPCGLRLHRYELIGCILDIGQRRERRGGGFTEEQKQARYDDFELMSFR